MWPQFPSLSVNKGEVCEATRLKILYYFCGMLRDISKGTWEQESGSVYVSGEPSLSTLSCRGTMRWLPPGTVGRAAGLSQGFCALSAAKAEPGAVLYV